MKRPWGNPSDEEFTYTSPQTAYQVQPQGLALTPDGTHLFAAFGDGLYGYQLDVLDLASVMATSPTTTTAASTSASANSRGPITDRLTISLTSKHPAVIKAPAGRRIDVIARGSLLLKLRFTVRIVVPKQKARLTTITVTRRGQLRWSTGPLPIHSSAKFSARGRTVAMLDIV